VLPTGDPPNPKPEPKRRSLAAAPPIAQPVLVGFQMSYWAVARLEPRREQLALRCLGLAGYETYFPRLREHRISHGRRIEIRPPLFPGYCFLAVEAQWYAARWSIGVIGLIMDGVRPARVADQIIDDLRKRERNGLIELPKRPATTE